MKINLSEFMPDAYYPGLEYIGTCVPHSSYIVECGTCDGRGACALSRFGTEVHTFDIQSVLHSEEIFPPHVHFHRLDCQEIDRALLSNAAAIYLDISPHAGAPESAFYDMLRTETTFRGLLFCDDIDYCDGMKRFWDSITLPKWHLGTLVHHSGFGIVSFDPSHEISGC